MCWLVFVPHLMFQIDILFFVLNYADDIFQQKHATFSFAHNKYEDYLFMSRRDLVCFDSCCYILHIPVQCGLLIHTNSVIPGGLNSFWCPPPPLSRGSEDQYKAFLSIITSFFGNIGSASSSAICFLNT